MLPLMTLPNSSEGQLSEPSEPPMALPPTSSSSEAASQPSIEDTSSVGGWVWIVLFGWVMALSLVANLALSLGIFCDRRKWASPVHLLLQLLFIINLMDYALLSFEFSLGVEHTFPYGQTACLTWQAALRATPILQAFTVAALLHVTARNFIFSDRSTMSSTSPVLEEEQGRLLAVSSRRGSVRVITSVLLLLSILSVAVAVPTLFFSGLVQISGEEESDTFCEVDPSSALGLDGEDAQRVGINIYYIVYSSVLSYWLPLIIALHPLLQLLSPRADSAKYPEISLALSTGVSFFLFYVLHACVVATRHSLDLAGLRVSPYHEWMLKVIQSLFWLLAYFWHFARPALVILLDPEIKESVLYSPSRLFCCYSSEATSVATSESEADNRERSPIVKRLNNEDLSSEKSEECRLALI